MPRNVMLRLDDGSIIGPSTALGSMGGGSKSTAMRLTVDKAVRIQPPRAGQKEVERLKRLISSVQQIPVDVVEQYHEEQDSKRARVETHPITSAEYIKCQKIFNEVINFLVRQGKLCREIFYNAVDGKMFPDYFRIIEKPMCLKQIEEKIQLENYGSAQEFHDDMMLVWSNCRTYNPENDPVRKLGDKAKAVFEKAWTNSRLNQADANRGKRSSVGVPSRKPQPQYYEQVATPKTGGAAKSAKKAGGEVSSGAPKPLTENHRAGIAAQLGDLPEEHMDGLMQLLPPEMLEGENGEFELDFDALNDTTLWKIDAFLKNIGRPATAGPQSMFAGGQQSGLRLDPDTSGASEDDDDSEDSG